MHHVDRNASAISDINSRINELENQHKILSQKQDKRFGILQQKLDNAPLSEGRSREASYENARRSIRAWPIEGDTEAELRVSFNDFAANALQIDDAVIEATDIREIILVRNSPSGRVHQEARITFGSLTDRDYFNSRARHQADFRDEKGLPLAGIRKDIPPYLLSTFRLLNDHGYDIRNAHGRETKRYVKYDDEKQSLILEVRLPFAQNWLRITPDLARSFSEEKNKMEYSSIRRELLKSRRTDRPSSLTDSNPNLIPIGAPLPSRSASLLSATDQ